MGIISTRPFFCAHHGQVKGEALTSRLEESVLVLAPQLDRRLWLLDTIITLAPPLFLREITARHQLALATDNTPLRCWSWLSGVNIG